MIRLPYGHSFLEIDEKNANVLQLKQQGLDDAHGEALVKTAKDQWQSQILARILMNHPIIFVTRPQLQKTIEDMKMIYASTIKEALDKARAIRGGSASITIIPNGVSVIVEP